MFLFNVSILNIFYFINSIYDLRTYTNYHPHHNYIYPYLNNILFLLMALILNLIHYILIHLIIYLQ